MRDFTTVKYHQLCKSMIENNYNILTVKDYLTNVYTSNIIILRHDVDSKPKFALRMAELEYKMDITSTYYFRHIKNVFNQEIIEKIHDMGHEIGYHYEVLSKCKGDYEKARELFKYELNDFRKICDINTISMHGSSLSKFDNRDMWTMYDFKDYGIFGEAYLSIENKFSYFSDTGWAWNLKNKLRDVILSKSKSIEIDRTDDLINIIENNRLETIYILVHPANWADNLYEWSYFWSENKVFNISKKVLRLIHNYEYYEDSTPEKHNQVE